MSAMDKINVKGLICLEAGTGAGNMTRWLAKKGAKLVYSISNNQEHLEYARRRLPKKYIKNVKFIKADLRRLDFLGERTIDLITAHMLVNVVTHVDLLLIFKELTRVAKSKALMVVNDYNPLSSYQTERSYLVEELFRIENAVSYLANGEPALVWYPSEYIAGLLELLGWEIETMELMYDKTPWEKELLEEHLEVIEEECKKLTMRISGKVYCIKRTNCSTRLVRMKQYMRAPYIVSLQDESSITHLTSCMHEITERMIASANAK